MWVPCHGSFRFLEVLQSVVFGVFATHFNCTWRVNQSRKSFGFILERNLMLLWILSSCEVRTQSRFIGYILYWEVVLDIVSHRGIAFLGPKFACEAQWISPDCPTRWVPIPRMIFRTWIAFRSRFWLGIWSSQRKTCSPNQSDLSSRILAGKFDGFNLEGSWSSRQSAWQSRQPRFPNRVLVGSLECFTFPRRSLVIPISLDRDRQNKNIHFEKQQSIHIGCHVQSNSVGWKFA